MRYDIHVNASALPCEPGTAQVVFHGINKSGSLAMAKVIHEAHTFLDREAEFVSHYHRGGEREKFLDSVDSSRPSRSFVVGHGLFGALRPAANRIWITQFRHPLPRTVSCYQWLKRNHERKTDEPFPSLEQFVIQHAGIGHSQIAQFGVGNGPKRMSRRRNLSARDLFDISVDQIEANISLIGIAEYFEESIFAFAAVCGLASVLPWSQDNRNKGRRPTSELEPHEVAAIEDHYRYDYELYKHALALFKEQNQRLGIETTSLESYRKACLSQYKDRLL